jgi:hypothetical protein
METSDIGYLLDSGGIKVRFVWWIACISQDELIAGHN